jgi:hypothetical protein
VALLDLTGERTVRGLADECGVHRAMIQLQKKASVDGVADIIERCAKAAPAVDEDTVRSPHAKLVG